MADDELLREFPGVDQKLAAPKKLSAFERERQAAEAKRQRAEAENAAALKAFQESFEDGDDDDSQWSAGPRGAPTGPKAAGFMGPGPPGGRYGIPKSGPGTLEPLLRGPPPPPSLKRKRALDEMREHQEALREQGLLDSREVSGHSPHASMSEDEQHDDTPKHTIQLSGLPPNMNVGDVKAILRDHLQTHSVRFLPPAGPVTKNKRSLTAIATLQPEVSIAQIDNAVSALKDHYLGCGFYLSISRHLSSAAIHPTMVVGPNATAAEPFGAEKPRDQPNRFSMRAAPPPMEQRGFVAPDAHDASNRLMYNASAYQDTCVAVRPPIDIETLRSVHTVVDHLLSEPDPERAVETEALLMSLPEVQRDERFAFLYDSRSPAGVYYRFCLWAPEYSDEDIRERKRRLCQPERVFNDVPIDWLPPYSQIPFPDLKALDQVVTDMDYVSSAEDSDDEDTERRFNSGRDGDATDEAKERRHLMVLQHARLVHLLSRLPTSNARLRKGDVARVTNFAINHAGNGAEEIVNTLLLNVVKPFSFSLAARYEDSDLERDEEEPYEPNEDLSGTSPPIAQIHTVQKESKRDEDSSSAMLVALYIISDVLSASATAGARNAWKYRQLFELGFKAQKTFEHLGRLDKELAWGRMKSEQWKRKISVVFGIWEGWSVFSNDVHEELKKSFLEPPLTEEEKADVDAERAREERRLQEEQWRVKFKKVSHNESPLASESPAPLSLSTAANVADGVDGEPMADDVDGAPMIDDLSNSLAAAAPMDGVDSERVDDNVGGVPMAEEMDGIPMRDDPTDNADTSLEGGMGQAAPERKIEHANAKPTAPNARIFSSGPRRRMRAEDMFADSDAE